MFGDTLTVQFKFNVARHPASFSLAYEQTNSGTTASDPTCLGLAEAINAEAANMQIFLASDTSYEGFEVRVLRGTPSPPSFYQYAAKFGSRTGQAIPLVRAANVELIQSDAMNRHNGRIYIPGIAEGDTTINRITGANVITLITSQMNALTTVSYDDGSIVWGFKLVVAERKSASNPNPVNHDVSGFYVREILASQRRRRTNEWGTTNID